MKKISTLFLLLSVIIPCMAAKITDAEWNKIKSRVFIYNEKIIIFPTPDSKLKYPNETGDFGYINGKISRKFHKGLMFRAYYNVLIDTRLTKKVKIKSNSFKSSLRTSKKKSIFYPKEKQKYETKKIYKMRQTKKRCVVFGVDKKKIIRKTKLNIPVIHIGKYDIDKRVKNFGPTWINSYALLHPASKAQYEKHQESK